MSDKSHQILRPIQLMVKGANLGTQYVSSRQVVIATLSGVTVLTPWENPLIFCVCQAGGVETRLYTSLQLPGEVISS